VNVVVVDFGGEGGAAEVVRHDTPVPVGDLAVSDREGDGTVPIRGQAPAVGGSRAGDGGVADRHIDGQLAAAAATVAERGSEPAGRRLALGAGAVAVVGVAGGVVHGPAVEDTAAVLPVDAGLAVVDIDTGGGHRVGVQDEQPAGGPGAAGPVHQSNGAVVQGTAGAEADLDPVLGRDVGGPFADGGDVVQVDRQAVAAEGDGGLLEVVHQHAVQGDGIRPAGVVV